MDAVRYGVIGVGNMGTSHARQFFNKNIDGAVLGAVCDTNPKRLEWAENEFGDKVRRFDNAEAMFTSGEVDAVIVATPHYDHPPLTIKALQAGLHVMCEKPAGVFTKAVREMNAVAEKSDKLFGLMFNQRMNPRHKKIHDLLQAGEVGEIRRICWSITAWFRTESYYASGGWRASWKGEGGGVLINQCPHQLDLLQWFCGLPTRVRAFCHFGKYHNIEVEDEVTAYMEYENGATGTFITSTGEAPGTNRLEICGDQGMLVYEHGQVRLLRTRQNVSEFCKTHPGGFATPETWDCQIPCWGDSPEHAGILRNFTNAILGKEELFVPGVDGIRGLTLGNAMLMSAWTDDWTDIPLDENRFEQLLNEKIENSTYVKEDVREQVEAQ